MSEMSSKEDDELFDAKFEEFGDLVFRRCFSLLDGYEEASDAAQLVWTKVYFALPGFRGDASFKTWLFRIVYNQCISIIRKRYKTYPLEDDMPVDPSMLKDELADKIMQKIDTAQLLEAIGHEEKALLSMKYVDKFTYEEMSTMLNLTESALKMRIARIKQRLVEEYGKKK